jgi:hypothetical protein
MMNSGFSSRIHNLRAKVKRGDIPGIRLGKLLN